MDRHARRALRAAAEDVTEWVAQAAQILAWRDATTAAVRALVSGIRDDRIQIFQAGGAAGSATAMTPDRTDHLIEALVARAMLPEAHREQFVLLERLTGEVAQALEAVPHAATWRRLVISPARRRAAQGQAHQVLEMHTQGTAVGLPRQLAALGAPATWLDRSNVRGVLDPQLGLADDLADLGTPHLLPPQSFAELTRAMADIDRALAEEEPLRTRVVDAVWQLRAPAAEAHLEAMPLEELRQVTTERLRLDLLADAGITTVGDLVARRREQLTAITGIGAKTADVFAGAAAELKRIAYDEAPVRLDPDQRTDASTALVSALVVWDARRRTGGAADDLAKADELRPLAAVIDDSTAHLLVLSTGHHAASGLEASIAAVVRRADRIAVAEVRPTPDDPWAEFVRRPADFYAMLAEIGVLGADQARSMGDLPAGLVDTVRAQELRTDDLRLTLREYQAFAARFALVQRRVVIGDEMGLGKTIEALAVLAHLWATGAQHFLVVCPAAVLTNWMREIEAKSTLPAYRVHGEARDAAFTTWREHGGVAVTTYATLGWLDRLFRREVAHLDCVVADEAHYVKNPDTWRARVTREQIAKADRVILMTGTPMENHVDEFRTLIGYVQPDLAAESGGLAPRAFRQHVAPAYLRRNIEDVLTELPELVETDDWLEMSEADAKAYRVAVADGNFAAMRRAALLQGAASAKVQRLTELVDEAEENDRRVVVFSYFRDVLDVLAVHLGGLGEPVFGPLTGSIAADRRQRIIDDFSAAEHGAVLLAQITTGGVGLNIQAASVVVICEPQLKPTTEAQAIARAHRMGQVRSVQVHRLLSEDSIDERITEILAAKQRHFDDFVRDSETALAAPEAQDFSDAELARQVVAAERARLLYEPPTVVTPDD